jgi:hypothetical protein
MFTTTLYFKTHLSPSLQLYLLPATIPVSLPPSEPADRLSANLPPHTMSKPPGIQTLFLISDHGTGTYAYASYRHTARDNQI